MISGEPCSESGIGQGLMLNTRLLMFLRFQRTCDLKLPDKS